MVPSCPDPGRCRRFLLLLPQRLRILPSFQKASQLQTHVDPFEQNSFYFGFNIVVITAPAVVTIPAPAGEVPQPPASQATGADAALAGAPSRGSPPHLSGFLSLGSPARAPLQAELLLLGTR